MRTSEETTDVRWVPVAELDALPMHRSMRERLEVFLRAPGTVHIG
ncbi:hypothetical protein L083_2611 [Actinoplanes sp. N902-109]|nr:hypothetical protein L083_2611 [Actinoplanes sp. N902-109]